MNNLFFLFLLKILAFVIRFGQYFKYIFLQFTKLIGLKRKENRKKIVLFGVNNDIDNYFRNNTTNIIDYNALYRILAMSYAQTYTLKYNFNVEFSIQEIYNRIDKLMEQHQILRLRVASDEKYIEPYKRKDYIKKNPSYLTKILHDSKNIIMNLGDFCEGTLNYPLIQFYIYENCDLINVEICVHHALVNGRTFAMLIYQLQHDLVLKTNYDDYFEFSKIYRNIKSPIIDKEKLLFLDIENNNISDTYCISRTEILSDKKLKETEFYHILLTTIYNLTKRKEGIITRTIDIGINNNIMDISNFLGNNMAYLFYNIKLLDKFDKKHYIKMLKNDLGIDNYIIQYAKICVNYRGSLLNINDIEYMVVGYKKIRWLQGSTINITLAIQKNKTYIDLWYSHKYYSDKKIDNFIELFKMNLDLFYDNKK